MELEDGPRATAKASLTEEYVLRLARPLRQEFGFVVSLPWSQPEKPDNVLAPVASGEDTHWSWGAVGEMALRFQTLLLPGTFECERERQLAEDLMTELEINDDVEVFILQLTVGAGADVARDSMQELLARHSQLLELGASGVLLDPEADPDALRQQVQQERAVFRANSMRVNLMLATYDQDVLTLNERHHKMIWESIPKSLMPNFAPLDYHLHETSTQVDRYKLQGRFQTVMGTVVLAIDEEAEQEDARHVVLKVITKKQVSMCDDLERMYREFRFLSDILKHPHIAHCARMMHGLRAVYFVLDFRGTSNLCQLLSTAPGGRLPPSDAMDIFTQMADALAYCHSADVVHRWVTLEHIVVGDEPEGHQYTLVDFANAVKLQAGATSLTTCGTLPCVSPEMMMGEPHGRETDCWSLGAVLLEAAGGLGSLRQAVPWEDESELHAVGNDVRRFFQDACSHERALTGLGAPQDERVLRGLSGLLKPEPAQRATMKDAASM